MFVFDFIIAFFLTISICALLDSTPYGRKVTDVILMLTLWPLALLYGVFGSLLGKK